MNPHRKTAGLGEGATAWKTLYQHSHSTTRTLPRDWRERLPAPANYYPAALPDLGKPNATGWAQARCPLHDDKYASLSVNVATERGGFSCFGCGAKGDMLSFHQQRTGLDFRAALRELLGLRNVSMTLRHQGTSI